MSDTIVSLKTIANMLLAVGESGEEYDLFYQ